MHDENACIKINNKMANLGKVRKTHYKFNSIGKSRFFLLSCLLYSRYDAQLTGPCKPSFRKLSAYACRVLIKEDLGMSRKTGKTGRYLHQGTSLFLCFLQESYLCHVYALPHSPSLFLSRYVCR